MYSIILLTALSTGADVTPPAAAMPVAPVVSSGCCGVSSGCCGSSMCYGSCLGNCSGLCHGYTSWQCHGGSCSGLFSGGLFSHRHHSCHGCCGGSSCCGFHNSCAGYSCCGGSYAGSTWGPPIGMPPYTLHGYNQGGWYGYGAPVIVGGTEMVPTTMAPGTIPPATTGSDAKPMDAKPNDKKPEETKKPMGMGANLKFRMPAETKLYIDGRLTSNSGTERVFTSPSLALGQKFYYEVKAELMVNGSPVVEELRVIVEAGSNIEEFFAKLFAAENQQKTVVAGK